MVERALGPRPRAVPFWFVDQGPLEDLIQALPAPSWPDWIRVTETACEALYASTLSAHHAGARVLEQDGRVMRVLPGPVRDALLGLRGGRPARHMSGRSPVHMAEDEALAICLAEHVHAGFIAYDKRAIVEALVQLGPGRGAHGYSLVGWLALKGAATPQQLTALRKKVHLHNQGLRAPLG